MRNLCITLVVSVILAASTTALAKEGCGGDCTSCHTLTPQEATGLLKKIGVTVKSVKQSPARGFFELLVEKDSQKGVILMDYGKKHFVQWMVVNLEKMEPAVAHKSEFPSQNEIPAIDVKTIPVGNAVIMGNPAGSKKLYVFTDPDCPYCRKGHTELKKLAKIAPDVAIYVMLFPLPMHPAAYDKVRLVLESKGLERLERLDAAFEGKDVPKPTTDGSKVAVDEIIKFAGANGISGTPTLVLPSGAVQVGIRDAESLKKMLETN